MSSSVTFLLLIRAADGNWTRMPCDDLQAVRRAWSARADAAEDAGILCSGTDAVSSGVFDSVAKRNAGRILLAEGIRRSLPPSFAASADPAAAVEGMRLYVGLRGWGDAVEDRASGGEGTGAADDPKEAPEEEQDWLGAFLQKNPDAADDLLAFGIVNDASYLAGESGLRPELRRRLGVFRAHYLAWPDRSDPCMLARNAPPWLRERKSGTLALPVRAANVFEAEGIGTVGDLARWSFAELLQTRNFGRLSMKRVRHALVAALDEGPTAIGGSSWVREDWVAAFLRENPGAAESLSGHGIRDEGSYLAGESELPPELRLRLGVFRAHHAAGADRGDPCKLAKAAPSWLKERKIDSLNLPTRVVNVFVRENVGTVCDLADRSSEELLGMRNFRHGSLKKVRQALAAALDDGPTAIDGSSWVRENWMAAFLRENPDAAESLFGHHIRDEDSYLAGESELPPELRLRLGVFRVHHAVGSDCEDPCKLAKAAPPWLKERKIDSLNLPIPVVDVVISENVRTVSDLAKRSSEKLLGMRNFGRRAMTRLRQALVAALDEGPTAIDGSSWVREDWVGAFLREHPDAGDGLSGHGIRDEGSYLAGESELPPELRRRLGAFRAHHAVGSDCEDPCKLAKAAPPWLKDGSIESLNLPTQIENVFIRENVRTVSDLAGRSSEELLGMRDFGRRSKTQLWLALVAAMDRGPLPSTADADRTGGFLEVFRRSLAALSDREVDVLTGHLGFEREAETLHRIGIAYGLTHERVRQIEARAVERSLRPTDWREKFARKLTAMLGNKERALEIGDIEREDSWFRGVSLHREFFANLFGYVLGDSFHPVTIDGMLYFGSMRQEKWQRLASSTAKEMPSLARWQWSEEEVRDFVRQRLPEEAREFADPFWRTLSRRCWFAPNLDGKRVFIGYGRSAEMIVMSILAESEKPLHYRKIAELADRKARETSGRGLHVTSCHKAVKSVGLLFSWGYYGLHRHLRLSDGQVANILGVAERIMLSQPERQWHTSEVVSELQRRSADDLKDLDKYRLDIVLAGSERLASLGRMTWTASGKETDRIDIRREVAAIVEEAGHPLGEGEIRERLRSRRGLNEAHRIVPFASLVPLQKGLWGINDRDLPVKRERQLELVEILVRRLEARQSAIVESELHDFLQLDGCPPRTFLIIAARDGRLKVSKKRCVYLVEWGDPRHSAD